MYSIRVVLMNKRTTHPPVVPLNVLRSTLPLFQSILTMYDVAHLYHLKPKFERKKITILGSEERERNLSFWRHFVCYGMDETREVTASEKLV